jgi:hypothetical protein
MDGYSGSYCEEQVVLSTLSLEFVGNVAELELIVKTYIEEDFGFIEDVDYEVIYTAPIDGQTQSTLTVNFFTIPIFTEEDIASHVTTEYTGTLVDSEGTAVAGGASSLTPSTLMLGALLQVVSLAMYSGFN